jgi:hypothetical protein
MGQGYQCGMLWGAALAAGSQAYCLLGHDPRAEREAILTSRRLVELFRARNKEINCIEIIEIELNATSQKNHVESSSAKQAFKFIIKGGPLLCLTMAARYARQVYDEIDRGLSGGNGETLSAPVSCASTVARKMGASDMHAIMASGFAGGIGLCGGACGALGAAIWILSMKGGMDKVGNPGYDFPETMAVMDTFMKITGDEFECSRIVGRKFESVDEHAAYIAAGDCSNIIEALAAQKSSSLIRVQSAWR